MAFIGYSEDYEDYQKTHEESESSFKVKKGKVNIIDNIEPISDDDLKLLNLTRPRHNYHIVYMNSDLEHFPADYNSREYDSEIESEVRSLPRTYRTATKYFRALEVLNEYYQMLFEKYGGMEEFKTAYKEKRVKEYIPHPPIFIGSKEEQEKVRLGYVPGETLSNDDDLEVKEENFDYPEQATTENNDTVLPILSPVLKNEYYKILEEREIRNSAGECRKDIVRYDWSNDFRILEEKFDTSDVSSLINEFYSWYIPKEDENENYFKESSSNQAKRFYGMINETPSSDEILDLIEEREQPQEEDLDELVLSSSKSNDTRYMTRGEFNIQQVVDSLQARGWNAYRIMRIFNIGTGFELSKVKLREMKEKDERKKRKRNAEAIARRNKKTNAPKTFADTVDGYYDVMQMQCDDRDMTLDTITYED